MKQIYNWQRFKDTKKQKITAIQKYEDTKIQRKDVDSLVNILILHVNLVVLVILVNLVIPVKLVILVKQVNLVVLVNLVILVNLGELSECCI